MKTISNVVLKPESEAERIATERMNSKRTYVATFWRGNPQLKNGGYYTTKEFQAVSHKAAERQAERYTKGMIYGSLNLISVELKQENSNGE